MVLGWAFAGACAEAPAPQVEDPAAVEARLREEVRQELEREYAARFAATQDRAPRPTLGEAERQAIEEAKARRASGAPDEAPAVSDASGQAATAGDRVRPGRQAAAETLPAPRGGRMRDQALPSLSPDRLTRDERRALADDPAVRGGRPRQTPSPVSDPTPSPSRGTPVAPPAGAMGTLTEAQALVGREGVTIWPGPAGLALVDLVVAEAVESREPVGPAARFSSPPERLVCFSMFDSATDDQPALHVWRRGDRVVSRVELTVGRSPKWRTWSRQRMRPDWTGVWSCEVLDGAGRRLGLAEFQVGG